MGADQDVEVIFQGAKCFWRTRNTVDIMLVLHKEFNVIEVITYEPSFNKEAPRIYLNNNIVDSKIDQSEVEEKMRLAKEPILRRREVPNNEVLLKNIINNTKADYVMNRLSIAEFSPEKQIIRVEIQFNFRDFDDAYANGTDITLICCDKPKLLQRYKSPHYQTLMEGLVDQMLETLDDEKRKIQLLRRKAGEYEDNVEFALTTDERWRIPIIFIKVKNGKALKKSDNRIWSILTRDIAPGDVKTKIAAALEYSLPAATAPTHTTVGSRGQGGGKVAGNGAGGGFITTTRPKTGRRPTGQTPVATGARGASSSTPTSLHRASTQSANTPGNAFSAGLSAMGASMKRRLGLTVRTGDDEDTEAAGEDSSAEAGHSKSFYKRSAAQGASRAKTPAEPVNPRGTNISITPKPRSYLIRPKTPGAAAVRTSPQKDGAGAPLSPDKSASGVSGVSHQQRLFGGKASDIGTLARGSASADVGDATSVDTACKIGEEKVGKVSAGKSSFDANSISARFSAGFSAFSASMKRTFTASTKRNNSIAVMEEDEPLTGDNDDFNSKPAALLNPAGHRSSGVVRDGSGSGDDDDDVVGGGGEGGSSATGSRPQLVIAANSVATDAAGVARREHLLSPKPVAFHRHLSAPVTAKGTASSAVSTPKSLHSSPGTPAPTPTASSSSGDASASSSFFFGGAASAEEYRENMLRKQAESTARSYHNLSSLGRAGANGGASLGVGAAVGAWVSQSKYALSPQHDTSEATQHLQQQQGQDQQDKQQHASLSPIEQFFSSFLPWSKSGKIKPSVPAVVFAASMP